MPLGPRSVGGLGELSGHTPRARLHGRARAVTGLAGRDPPQPSGFFPSAALDKSGPAGSSGWASKGGLWSWEEEWAAARPVPAEKCPVGRGRAEPAGLTEGGRVGLETPGGARTGGEPGSL